MTTQPEDDPSGPRETVLDITLAGESETESLAHGIAARIQAGDVICLFGDLGAGKSHFARAFIRALTHADQEVPSPTFTLVQVYDAEKAPGPLEIWHADLYRLGGPEEIAELGLADAFTDAVVLIEWPERALSEIPGKRLEIHLSFCDKATERRARLLGGPSWAERLRGISPAEAP